jgi:beta-galactosidase
MTPLAPKLTRGGIRLGDELVPLLSGSLHYWRLPRNVWRPALVELRKLGTRFVDTYLPWNAHEVARGVFDFGRKDPRLDVRHFLNLASEVGLFVIARPGPHVNAELTHFGIPERVVWDDACQARSAARGRVILPMPPVAFPVPSYSSAAFHAEAATWLESVAREIAPLAWPAGPVALVQVDNEGSLYFRDGPYDQDYHPDAIAQYRRYLRRRYGSEAMLRAAHRDPNATFDALEPPSELDATTADELPRHLDWAEFQEASIEAALYRFGAVLKKHGLGHLPMFHNMPLAEGATPLDIARLEHAVDFVALDYYHHASETIRAEIARRTTGIAVRSAVRDVPAFAAEMGAGFAPYFPPLRESDNEFSALSALAYGLRGLNIYMAVCRDRWIGGPIDSTGRPRPSSEFWKNLFSALGRTKFHELTRRAAVCLVVPRAFERLVRVTHAFEVVPPTAFALGGHGAELGGLEGELDPTSGATVAAERFLTSLERILERKRVPFAVVRDDILGNLPAPTRWSIVVCAGSMDERLTALIGDRQLRNVPISVGPLGPERDQAMRPSRARLPTIQGGAVPSCLSAEPRALEAAVDAAVQALGIDTLPAEPDVIHSTVHHDEQGRARVLFVINASREPVEALAVAPGARSARDALTLEKVLVTGEHVVLPVPGRTVRMLELSTDP